MAFPFPVMAPISSTVLLRIPLLEMFHLVRYPNWQSAITGTGRDSFVPFPVLGVPFPVLGYAISGTVIHWAPYRNWTLCAWSHFRYRALPVPVWSFFGSRTRIGIHVRGPISGAFLILDEVRGISLSLSFRDKHAPEPENKKNERSTQYRKCDFPPVLVPLLEMGRPFSVLVNCVFGYLHRYILQQ